MRFTFRFGWPPRIDVFWEVHAVTTDYDAAPNQTESEIDRDIRSILARSITPSPEPYERPRAQKRRSRDEHMRPSWVRRHHRDQDRVDIYYPPGFAVTPVMPISVKDRLLAWLSRRDSGRRGLEAPEEPLEPDLDAISPPREMQANIARGRRDDRTSRRVVL